MILTIETTHSTNRAFRLRLLAELIHRLTTPDGNRELLTRSTATFITVSDGPTHVHTMANESKIFPGAHFFLSPFFYGWLVQVNFINF